MADFPFQIDIDALGIANAIKDGVQQDQNREGFVKNLSETAYYQAKEQYNVMVFNLSQPYSKGFNGVQFYGSATWQSVVYGIWIFEDGDFTNQGDGGYINWSFQGSFSRDGDQGHHVTFSKR